MTKTICSLSDSSKQNEILRLAEKVHTFFISETAKDISKSYRESIKRLAQETIKHKFAFIVTKYHIEILLSEIELAKGDLRQKQRSEEFYRTRSKIV